jgi:hypothetical protein
MPSQTKQGDREGAQERQVLWSIAGPGGTRILFQDDILDPVQAVLDLPVAANHLGEGLCLHEAAADVEHVLVVGLSAPCAESVN